MGIIILQISHLILIRYVPVVLHTTAVAKTMNQDFVIIAIIPFSNVIRDFVNTKKNCLGRKLRITQLGFSLEDCDVVNDIVQIVVKYI